jgi:NAD(P)-dependent dehydrogenase (short-subunit alcohol dehydrogenase family)
MYPFAGDARKEVEVVQIFDNIERSLGGKLELVIFNIGAWYKQSILTLTERKYRKIWEMASLAGFLVGREAAQRLLRVPDPDRKHAGTIIFTGATASTRGNPGFSAFSGAKASLRMLSQSMSRELGPMGVHVAHVVIDGGIDTAFVRRLIGPDRLKLMRKDSLLDPAEIAKTYLFLHAQHRSAWTREVDLRPYCEGNNKLQAKM